jgi:hypothetical protein
MKIFYLVILGSLLWLCNSKKDDIEPGQKAETFRFVAVTGNDNDPGTFEHPWATWQKAFSMAEPGDTVYIRGGIYYADAGDEYGVFISGKKGTHRNPVCIFNYPGERPVLDCSTITSARANVGIMFDRCTYYHLKGLTVTGISQHAWDIGSCGFEFDNGGTYEVENCNAHNNEGSGFQGYNVDSIYLINCDSYNNYDLATTGYSGGQADGFVFCYTARTSFTCFKGCRSWYNSDDGFDCWENEGIVVFDNCWAFNNGRGEGDGSGFKLGQTIEQPQEVPQRILTNCLAFKNRFIGFNQNDGNTGMIFYNNFAYDNDGIGYDIGQFTNEMIVRNNISYKNGSTDYFSPLAINDHNSWNPSTNIVVTDLDFMSIDSTGVSGKRQSNGDLPVLSFLRLAEGSDLINAGINIGLPFAGTAPDLGPYEKQ